MNVGIVTFHFVNNYGGVLQAYALRRVIAESCGVNCFVIDYRNPFIRFTDTVRLLPITFNAAEIGTGFLTTPKRIGRSKRFSAFIEKNIPTTKRYSTLGSLRRNGPKCDVLVSGSDQIWNPIITGGVDGAYYLQFADDAAKKIAYAPSFGGIELGKRQEQKVAQYVRQYDFVSAREPDGVARMKSILGHSVPQLIDPTLLIDADEWLSIAEKLENLPKEYLLLYMMQHDEAVYRHVESLRHTTELPVVAISRYGYAPSSTYQTLVDIGPAEYLYLFANAKMVCTNSFHGLAFSIIFNKQLRLVPSKRFSGRIASLLQLLGRDYSVTEDQGSSITLVFGDSATNAIIATERQRSRSFLHSAVLGYHDFDFAK